MTPHTQKSPPATLRNPISHPSPMPGAGSTAPISDLCSFAPTLGAESNLHIQSGTSATSLPLLRMNWSQCRTVFSSGLPQSGLPRFFAIRFPCSSQVSTENFVLSIPPSIASAVLFYPLPGKTACNLQPLRYRPAEYCLTAPPQRPSGPESTYYFSTSGRETKVSRPSKDSFSAPSSVASAVRLNFD